MLPDRSCLILLRWCRAQLEIGNAERSGAVRWVECS